MGAFLAFRVDADPRAQAWLEAHPASQPRVITYEVARCCHGGKICDVSVRKHSREDEVAGHATAVLGDGSRLLVDRRAAARLPSRFGLTVRGVGPFKRLDLALDGDEWATLLFD